MCYYCNHFEDVAYQILNHRPVKIKQYLYKGIFISHTRSIMIHPATKQQWKQCCIETWVMRSGFNFSPCYQVHSSRRQYNLLLPTLIRGATSESPRTLNAYLTLLRASLVLRGARALICNTIELVWDESWEGSLILFVNYFGHLENSF